jgi:TatD DNase family protein
VLVDTHCHLADPRFDDDRDAVLERARAAGVQHVVIIADSVPNTERAVELANHYGQSATAGVHPHEAASWNPETAARIEALLDDPAVVAVGETGLDYHYDHSPREAQRRAFAAQLNLAAARGLPVVVHARSADEDIVAMLRDAGATVVLHSFSSGPTVLDMALQRGTYVSFSGMVTFRSWNDTRAVTEVSRDKILVETDAPFLAPVPHRGKRNEPAFVRDVAATVAELRSVPLNEIIDATTANAARCFGQRLTQPS